jgi:hypothetical protein
VIGTLAIVWRAPGRRSSPGAGFGLRVHQAMVPRVGGAHTHPDRVIGPAAEPHPFRVMSAGTATTQDMSMHTATPATVRSPRLATGPAYPTGPLLLCR